MTGQGTSTIVSPFTVRTAFLEEEHVPELQKQLLEVSKLKEEVPELRPSSESTTTNTLRGAGKQRMLNLLGQHALFPKICTLASTDFAMAHCDWHVSRAHRRAARWVMYSQYDILNAFTVEISLFGIHQRPTSAESSSEESSTRSHSIQLFTPRRAEWIGVTLGRALVPFLHSDGGNHRSASTSPASLPFLTFEKLQPPKLANRVLKSFEQSLTDVITRETSNSINFGGGRKAAEDASDSDSGDDAVKDGKKNSSGGGKGSSDKSVANSESKDVTAGGGRGKKRVSGASTSGKSEKERKSGTKTGIVKKKAGAR